MNCIVKIESEFGDPITISEAITIPLKKDILRVNAMNKFIGYFGFTRSNDSRYWSHTGYDYQAKEGTEVFAVGDGEIVQVRIGAISPYYETKKGGKSYYYYKKNGESKPIKQRKEFVCPLRESMIDKNGNISAISFSGGICEKCKKEYFTDEGKTPIRKNCFGVQVWLKIDNSKYKTFNQKYAFYAHLSQLNEMIWEKIKTVRGTENTYSFKEEPIKISAFIDDKTQLIIGKSGCTGNASGVSDESQQHLHFECRTGIETKEGKRVSPNKIVKTKFYIQSNSNESNDIIEEITEEVIGIDEASIKKYKSKINKEYSANWQSIKDTLFKRYEPIYNTDSKNTRKQNWYNYLEKERKENIDSGRELEKVTKELKRLKDELIKLEKRTTQNKTQLDEKTSKIIKVKEKIAITEEWEKVLIERTIIIKRIKHIIFLDKYPTFKQRHDIVQDPEPLIGDIVAQYIVKTTSIF